jgi:hypothetical protein
MMSSQDCIPAVELQISRQHRFQLQHRNPQERRLEGFHVFMRMIWNTVRGDIDLSKSEELGLVFKDELWRAYATAKSEWNAIDRELRK